MSFLFLITPVQSIGGPIIINRNQFDINVYLIFVFYFMSAFNQCILGLISVDKLYDWASYF